MSLIFSLRLRALCGLLLISGTHAVMAAPVVSDDSYDLVEDLALVVTTSGAIVDEDFDGGSAGPGSFEGQWSYLDQLENANGTVDAYPTDGAGRAWNDPDFDTLTSSVAGWSNGDTPLQGGGITGFPAAPDLLLGIGTATNGGNLVTTYLFRNTFTLTAAEAAEANWELDYLVDDGAAFYINGTEIHRTSNLVDDPLTTESLANSTLGEDQRLQAAIDLSGLLVAGTNSVAVEVHQTSTTSSDAGFDLLLAPASSGGGGTFSYVDGPFPSPFNGGDDGLSSGSLPAGEGFTGNGLRIDFGGGPSNQSTASGGAWRVPINLSSAGSVQVSFRYRLVADSGFEPSEANVVLFAADGVLFGAGGNDFVAEFVGDGNGGGDQDTGWASFQQLLPLSAGEHTLDFGAFNTGSSTPSEIASAWFDDIVVQFDGAGGSGTVLANDSGDPATLIATLASEPAHGSVVLNANGSFTYTPAPNYFGTDSFTYTASDASGTSAPATVTLTIAPRNDPPVASDRLLNVEEDSSTSVPGVFGLTNNVTDIENDTLTFALASQAANGTATIASNGAFTYTPNPDFTGSDSFTYLAADSLDPSGPATVSVLVSPINDPPVAVDDSYTTVENTILAVSQSGAPSPQAAFASSFEGTLSTTITGVTNTESAGAFASLPGFGGAFLRNRTSGNPADATVITVSGLPEHDQLSIGFVLAVIDSWDGNGDEFTVRVDGAIAFSTSFRNSDDGAQGYNPPAGVELARRVDLGFSSGGLDLDSAYDMSLEPALQSIAHTADTATIEIFASGSDWGGGDDESWAIDDLQVSVTNSGIKEPIAAGSVWRFLDDGSNQGTAWQQASFNDSGWSAGAAELGYGDGEEVTIVDYGPDEDNKYPTTYFRRTFVVEDPSTLETATVSIRRDDGAAIYINGLEVARDANLPAGTAFDEFATGNTPSETAFAPYLFDPAILVQGTNTIAVEVHQDDGRSSDISFDLRLRTTDARAFGVIENDSDIDSPALTATVLSPPANGSLTLLDDGSFTYEPALNFEGNDSFTYTLSDGELSDTATVNITVTPGPNDLPVTGADGYLTIEDAPITISPIFGVLANDSDPEGATLTAVLESDAANGSVALAADGSFTYTPAPDFNGPDTFLYRAHDGIDASAPVTASVTVLAQNDTPTAVADRYLTAPGSTLQIAAPGVISNDIDIDNDPLTAQLVSPPTAGGGWLNTDGSFVYSPPAGFAGTVTFTYLVNDGQESSTPITVTIDVNAPANIAPDNYAATEDTLLQISAAAGVLANDSDPENGSLTASLVNAPSNGSLTLAPDGSFNYTPNTNFNGNDSFTYVAMDGLQASSATSVTINVSAVDDPPVAVADSYGVLIGESVNVSAQDGVLTNDSDVEGDSITAELGTTTTNGSLLLFPNGAFFYTPNANFTGTDSFTYTAISNGAPSAETTVELFVGAASESVAISEIMFQPSSSNDAEEFIELHNTGAAPVRLQDWRITSGVSFIFPDVILPAGGHVVIAADPATFEATYGTGVTVVGPWSGSLSNTGERIRIKDAADTEVDDITYSDQGDWAQRRPEVNGGEDGWIWENVADGGGASLELINPELSNKRGQNWAPSVSAPTPGATNSNYSLETPPLVLNVKHSPALPRPGDAVTVSAKLVDTEGSSLSATLHWRISTMDPDPFTAAAMTDVAMANSPPSYPGSADGTVIEFYVEGSDATSSRTWPAPSAPDGTQGANALFQFDSEEYAGDQPIYRMVMTVEEDDEFLFDNHSRNSDAQKNVTLIARQGDDFDIRYQCGVRVRGAGSRSRDPRNNRLNIPRDDPWNDVTKINLNTQFVYLQVLGSKLAAASGIEAADGKPVQLRHNGVNHATDSQNERRYGSYIHLEPIGGEWADVHFPDDKNGNIYSKGRPDVKWEIQDDGEGGPDIAAYLSDGWSKSTNSSDNDWTDLHDLFILMDAATGPLYRSQIEATVDTDQWARWFAYMTIVLSRETNLSNGTDDDYKMWRGMNDPRWKLIPHDFDTIFGLGDTSTDPDDSLFPPITSFGGQTFPQLVPFFDDPDICRAYYADMKELLETVFTKERFDATVENCIGWVPTDNNVRSDIISFMDARRDYILSQIPSSFSATSTLATIGGYFRADEAGVSEIEGTLDSTQTANVLVGGQPAELDIRAGTWSLGAQIGLLPGINKLPVRAFDVEGSMIWEDSVVIWFDTSTSNSVSGTLNTNTIWTATSGPYLVTSDIVVPVGVTLTILPGTTVFFADDTRITVFGRLIASGMETARITFASEPGAGGWDGVYFQDTDEANSMAYLDMDGSDAGSHSVEVDNSRLDIDHMTWTGTTETILELSNPQVIVTNSTFPGTDGAEAVHGSGLDGSGYFTLRGNTFQSATGYNDVIDFTGGRRSGPIIYIADNVFNGASDDVLDLDGTDAHIEGNVFLNIHTDDPSRESTANAIATDNSSHLTIVRNLFVDIDHVLLLKNSSDAVFENNTVVDATIGVFNFDEPERSGFVPGRYLQFRGNAFDNVTTMFINQFATEPGEISPIIDAAFNILPTEHHDLGSGNIDADPLLATDYTLAPGSPAIGSGINGADMGFDVPAGVTISGGPAAITRDTTASFALHITGISGIQPPSGFLREYQYRLDGGAWLTHNELVGDLGFAALSAGAHTLEVIGRDSAGFWQPFETAAAFSWTIDPALSRLLITEVMASNDGSVDHEGTSPDYIEIWNDSASARDVGGMVLSDTGFRPGGWTIPANTVILAGERLVVWANQPDATTGLHSGFSLDDDGESVSLFDTFANGSGLLDQVQFGFQVPGLSIARVGADQSWALAAPTPGAANGAPISTGSPALLVINEWLSTSGIVFDNDFVELYNPSSVPVSLSGLTLTDDPNNDPGQHVIAPLSFIAPMGFTKFIADNDPEQGASHLSFNLSKLLERIGLFDAQGNEIDYVQFANGVDDSSGGRIVDGAELFATFAIPTPGFSNGTDLSAETAVLQSLRITELMYNPIQGGDFEYVKLQNIGTASISLGGVQFDEGISIELPDVALAPGEVAYIASDQAAFEAAYGNDLNLVGIYSGQLSNGGERIRMEIASLSAGILDFDYDDAWYPTTDGGGPSLVIIDATATPATWSDAVSWRPSITTGTPSYDDWVSTNFGAPAAGITGENDDPDSDGIANLLEYAFRLDPNVADDDRASLPQLGVEGGFLTLSYTTAIANDITVLIEVSTNLDFDWTDAGATVDVHQLNISATSRTFKATDTIPITGGQRFLRLRVERNP